MGRIRVDIMMKTGEVDHYVVDSVIGYGFAGGYLIINTEDGQHKPYSLADIDRFITTSAETVH